MHTVAITRIRCHAETRAYEARRTLQGKTHRDIRRCLKRTLARHHLPRHRNRSRPSPNALRGLTNIGASNGLIREYLPKGIELTSHQPYLDAIADELNDRPRAVLGFLTPREVFTKQLNDNVATTA